MAQAGEIEWVKMKILRRGRIKSAPPEIEIGGRTNEGKNERTGCQTPRERRKGGRLEMNVFVTLAAAAAAAAAPSAA